MKNVRNFILGMDLLLLCILAGKAAENGMLRMAEEMGRNEGTWTIMKESDVNTKDLTKKKVALTFDDGPNQNYTEMLLEGLKERGVHATFFLLGKQVEQSPQIVKKMHRDGHLIGNHSYEHVNLSSLSDEAAMKQVDMTILRLCYATSCYRIPSPSISVRRLAAGRAIWIMKRQ